jgi:site-specific recombinase XerD
MAADALQALLDHEDYSTTQRYINMARQLNPTAQDPHVPLLPPRQEGQSRDEKKA